MTVLQMQTRNYVAVIEIWSSLWKALVISSLLTGGGSAKKASKIGTAKNRVDPNKVGNNKAGKE